MPVHTVVLGRTATGEPGPNVALLQQIADITGGRYFRATNEVALDSIYQTIDELVPPSDVEGIEVYKGAATIPVELNGTGSACGVVSIWTR